MSGQDESISSSEYADLLDEMKDHDALFAECSKKITECFQAVAHKLNRDEAWRLFAEFVRLTQPKKKKGQHNPKFDAELLSAYDSATDGEKTGATNAVGQKYKKSNDTTQKHLRRRLAERKEFQAALRRWMEGGPPP